MTDLPFHLKALPPEALDVLRYYGTLSQPIASSEAISDAARLSERMFGKIIRRLVTRGYVQMDGDQTYRLTDAGQRALVELRQYDDANPSAAGPASGPARRVARCVLALAAPQPLLAGTPAAIYVGMYSADGGSSSGEVLLRVSLLNAEPTSVQQLTLPQTGKPITRTLQMTPGRFRKMRIRLQAFQSDPFSDDVIEVGGMYVDLDITTDTVNSTMQAFVTELELA